MSRELFNEYVKNFDMNNDNIKRKYFHSLRVEEEIVSLAKNLNLNKEEIEIARLLGLLHDIGRFNQIKEFNTFDDRVSFDHALEGCKVLTENNYIDKYTKDEKAQNLILKGIMNHNKTFIETKLTESEILFSKMIRDADKLDIFKILAIDEYIKVDGKLNKDIYERIMSCSIDYEVFNNKLDKYALDIGTFLDLNFKYSIEKALKENYLEKIVNKIIEVNPEYKEEFLNMKEKIEEFLKEKVN